MTPISMEPCELSDPWVPDPSDLAQFFELTSGLESEGSLRLSRPLVKQLPATMPQDAWIKSRLTDVRGATERAIAHRSGDIAQALLDRFGSWRVPGVRASFPVFSLCRNRRVADREFEHWLAALVHIEFAWISVQTVPRSFRVRYSDWIVGELMLSRRPIAYEPLLRDEPALTVQRICTRLCGAGIGSFVVRCLRQSAIHLGVPLVIEQCQTRLSQHLHSHGWVRVADEPYCSTWVDPRTLRPNTHSASYVRDLWAKRAETG